MEFPASASPPPDTGAYFSDFYHKIGLNLTSRQCRVVTGIPGAMERNFSALLPIIVSGIDRTPQFLLTGSRSATKSVCGRENIDDYRDADGHRRCPGAKLSPTQDITVRDRAIPSFANTPRGDDAAGNSTMDN